MIFAASLNQAAQREGVSNIYSTSLLPNNITTKVTDFQGDEAYRGVMTLDLAATGRIVLTLLADFINQIEEIRLVDGNGSRLIGTDKEGCPSVACVSCYTVCIRNVHITANGGTVPTPLGARSRLRRSPWMRTIAPAPSCRFTKAR